MSHVYKTNEDVHHQPQGPQGRVVTETPLVYTKDPPIWGRADCQRGEGNPELQAEFEKAKATCLARGETAAAVAGTVGNSPCMNEQGYVLRMRAEHVAACQTMLRW